MSTFLKFMLPKYYFSFPWKRWPFWIFHENGTSGIEIAFSVYHRYIFRTPTPYIWTFLDISLVTMLTQLVV